MASFRIGFDSLLLMTDLPVDHMVQNQGASILLTATTEEGLYEEDVTYVDPMGTAVFPSGTSMLWARAPTMTRKGQTIRVFVGPIGETGL